MNPSKSNAQRQREHRAKLLKRGLVRRQVWCHEQNLPEFAALERLLMDEQFCPVSITLQNRETGRLTSVRIFNAALSGNAEA